MFANVQVLARIRALQILVEAAVVAVPMVGVPAFAQGTTSTTTATTTVSASAPLTPSEAYAVQLRAQFGFRNDVAYVRAVNIQANTTQTDLGISLTPGEAAEMQRRQLVGAQIAGIDAAEVGDATYAGAWLDQQAGGVLNVAFTVPPSTTTLTSLTRQLPPGTAVTVRPATVSLARLTALENQIGVDLAGWKAKGVTIVGSSVDIFTNTTTVCVTSDIATAINELEAAYGSAGLLVEAPTGPTTGQSSRDIRTGPPIVRD